MKKTEMAQKLEQILNEMTQEEFDKQWSDIREYVNSSSNELVKKLFNLNDLLDFEKTHTIEMIIGSDHMYHCYINGVVWETGVNFLETLILAIDKFKKQ
jgi:flagellar motor switch protein FliG